MILHVLSLQEREMGHLSCFTVSSLLGSLSFSLKFLPLYGSLAICGQHLAISLLPFLKI